MNEIRVQPSAALDALCLLQKRRLDDVDWMNPPQIKEIRFWNDLLPDAPGDDCPSMSSLCLIVSAYFDGNLETLSLDDLISAFRTPEKIEETVKERIRDEFRASYLFPMLERLKNGIAETICHYLENLKTVNYETLYRDRVLPSVQIETARLKKVVDGYDAGRLFSRIACLKNELPVDHTDVYVSFFSYPIAFSLYREAFLSCFTNAIDFYPVIAHELMHGFASDGLIRRYREAVARDERLNACHRALIENYRSGDEEEFVLAAEHYLCLLSGRYTKEALTEKIKAVYGGNCPTALALFERLTEEKEVPCDYDRWLLESFFPSPET